MTKIRFRSSSAFSELHDACVMVGDGVACLAKALGRLFDIGAHRFPYAYLFILAVLIAVPSALSVMQARADRDAASKRAYEMQQKLDSVTVFNEARL